MSNPGDTITVYSDYVCPFCYLGRQSLDAYQETRDRSLAINWHPFDLRSHKRGPDGTIDDSVSDEMGDAYFDQVRQNVAHLQDQYDADEMLNLDELPDDVDSFNAQAASFHVDNDHPDRWLAFDEAIFEAFWLEGRDIGDIEVLAAIAENVGIDPEDIRTAVEDEAIRAELRDQFTEAQSDGVTGVPTFIVDDHVARGAVPPEQLERLVEGA